MTKQASIDFNPVWSPDGRYIAFCRILKGETGIYIIPALGGAERRVLETLWEEQRFDEVLWSAGRLLVVTRREVARVFLTVPPVMNLLLFFSYRSIRWKFADSLAAAFEGCFQSCILPRWSNIGFHQGFARLARIQSIYTVPVSGGENSVLSRMLHTTGVLRGL